ERADAKAPTRDHGGVAPTGEPRPRGRRRRAASVRTQADGVAGDTRIARGLVVSLGGGRLDAGPPAEVRNRQHPRHHDLRPLRGPAEPEGEEPLRVRPEIARAEDRDDQLAAVVRGGADEAAPCRPRVTRLADD